LTMIALPLREVHRAAGAVFGPVGEWELPLRYAGLEAEHQAAKASLAVADVSFLAKRRFTGPDAQAFLHGLLTSDIEGLAVGQAALACLLTPKGKIIAPFWLCHRGGDFLALAEPAAAAALHAGLQKFLLLSDTRLEDASDLGLFLVLGPKAGAAAAAATSVFPLGPHRLVVCRADAAANTWTALIAAGARPLGHEALEALRVEAGVPAFGREVLPEVFPQEVNLGAAISYDKGCYLGQETMARIRTYGRLQRRLVGLKTERPIVPGDVVAARASGRPGLSDGVADSVPVGQITSAVFSPALNAPLALAVVRAGDAVLTVQSAGQLLPAAIVPLPV